MRFLLDVYGASRVLHSTLTDFGHDVLSAWEGYANASDEALLDLAYREDRVLVTEDKDFGELVFSRGLRHPCIVRLDGLKTAEEASAMRDLIDRHGEVMRARRGSCSRRRKRIGVDGGRDTVIAVFRSIC